MEKRLVYHHNLIGHEINESLEYYADDVLDREIYCKKLHQIKEPLISDCESCSYFAGLEQGYGHECAWEDITEDEVIIKHQDRYKEYERVDKLIKRGILQMEDMDLVAKVKNKPYDKEKWIYLQSEDMKNRYLLGTTGKKTLVCCGVNPSYASPEDLDPTMKNVEKFARKYEYDSYVMINLYPMRATKPKNMHEIMDTSIAEKNYQYIENLLKSGNCDIWAAWGTIIETRTYLKECLARIVKMADKYNSTWYTIGQVSKKGHPHHPLYLGKDSERAVFDVHKYLNLL